MVAFDLRIFHASWGGSDDRHMSCVSFFHYPETPKELETMRHIAAGYLKPSASTSISWDDGIWEEWLSNPQASAKRQSWLDKFKKLAAVPQSQTGLRLVFDKYGSSTLAPLAIPSRK